MKKIFGSGWEFDDEWAILRGDRHPSVGKAARSTRAGILIELGRLIVAADAHAMNLFTSVGTAEWGEKHMLEVREKSLHSQSMIALSEQSMITVQEIVTGTVDHALNFISDWLDARYMYLLRTRYMCSPNPSVYPCSFMLTPDVLWVYL